MFSRRKFLTALAVVPGLGFLAGAKEPADGLGFKMYWIESPDHPHTSLVTTDIPGFNGYSLARINDFRQYRPEDLAAGKAEVESLVRHTILAYKALHGKNFNMVDAAFACRVVL